MKVLRMLLLASLIWGGQSAWATSLVSPHASTGSGSHRGTGLPLVAEAATTLGQGQIRLASTWGLSFTTAKFSPNWQRLSAGGDYTTLINLSHIGYGLTERLTVGVDLSYIHNWASDVNKPGPHGERYADFGGVGDLSLAAKYLLWQETRVFPAVVARVAAIFPTGHADHLNPARLNTDNLGGGTYGLTFGFNFSKTLNKLVLSGNAWYSTALTSRIERPEKHYSLLQVSEHVHPRDRVSLALAGELNITQKWVAMLAVYNFWEVQPLFGPKANNPPGAVFGIAPGIEFFPNDCLGFMIGVALDLAGKNASQNISPVFVVSYKF